MLRRPKPPEMPVEVVTKIIARAENQQRQDTSKMSHLFPIVVVNNEVVDQAPHRPAHAQRAENKSPHDFIKEVSGTGHDEYADGKEDNFGEQGVQPEQEEGTDVDVASFLGGFDDVRRGYDRLIGICWRHGGFREYLSLTVDNLKQKS